MLRKWSLGLAALMILAASLSWATAPPAPHLVMSGPSRRLLQPDLRDGVGFKPSVGVLIYVSSDAPKGFHFPDAATSTAEGTISYHPCLSGLPSGATVSVKAKPTGAITWTNTVTGRMP